MRHLLLYFPILTTLFSAYFATVLYRHWRAKPQSVYLMWWMIGVIVYGLGTVTESLTTLIGWHAILFRLWFIVGALLGGAALAQGTIYLMLSRRRADMLTKIFLAYTAVSSLLVLLTPLNYAKVVTDKLSGDVMVWQWVRILAAPINTYALLFLVGGAILSAWRYYKKQGKSARVAGNVLIATGALLPGIGGSFAAKGVVEALYVTEFIGILLIWWGYRTIVGDTSKSIHAAQKS